MSLAIVASNLDIHDKQHHLKQHALQDLTSKQKHDRCILADSDFMAISQS